MKKTTLDQAIAALEQERESHVHSVSEIETALSALRRLASANGHEATGRRTKKALKRNERTNERTSNTRAKSDATEPP